jgi:hypothetical protein
MMLGRIDEVDGDYVATEFAALTIPLKCMYVARSSPRATNPTGDGRTRIRKDWRSITLGYMRVWVPVVAVVLPAIQALTGELRRSTWLVSAAFLVLALVSYRSGRLPEVEKVRLRLLGSVTGLRIDPSKLNATTRDVKRDLLGQLMMRAGIPTTPDGILSLLDEIPVPAMPLVYGYACYAGDTPEWRACAAAIYGRYERAEK